MNYFWDNFEAFGDKTALITESESISYNKLVQHSDRIVSLIPERSLVFLVCKNTLASIYGYIGFLRKRIVPVLISDSIGPELFDNLAGTYKPQFIWCPETFSDAPGILSEGGYKLISTGNAMPLINDLLALLVSTSGSTGSPKLVRLSYQNIQSNTAGIVDSLGISESDKPITTLPMNYVYGLSIINTHLMKGAGIIVNDHGFLDLNFWSLFKEKGATTFGAVPFLYQILDKIDFYSAEMPSLQYITEAGGKLGKELHLKIAKAMHKKGKDFIVMYGASEATARMSIVPSEMAEEKPGSIGLPIVGGRFELIDDSGNVISDSDTVGELIYYGDNVMLGYAECLSDLALGDNLHGRLKTGDLAKRDADGVYYFIERKDRSIKVFGNRVNLSEIEALLSENGFDAAVTGKEDHINIYTSFNDTEKLISYITKATGLNRMAFSAFCVKSIPRTASGKIMYSELTESN